MKHIGNRFKYEMERDKELIKVFKQCLIQSNNEDLMKILEKTVNSPTTRFWVSEDRAAIVLSRMFKGDELENMSESKREMYQELFKRAVARRKKYPYKTVYEIAIDVTMQPAPKFYLTPKSAKTIICKIRKKWKKSTKS